MSRAADANNNMAVTANNTVFFLFVLYVEGSSFLSIIFGGSRLEFIGKRLIRLEGETKAKWQSKFQIILYLSKFWLPSTYLPLVPILLLQLENVINPGIKDRGYFQC